MKLTTARLHPGPKAMKFLTVFFLVGLTLSSAVPVPSSELSLKEVMELDFLPSNLALETDSSDLAKSLKEKFDEIARKIKDALENDSSFREGLEKIKEINDKLRELTIELREKGKYMVKELREKVKEYFENLQGKLKEIKDRFDASTFTAKIEENSGKGNKIAKKLIGNLQGKGEQLRDKILNLIQRFDRKKTYEKIRNYFRDFQIELKEKFAKFGEWAKDRYEGGLQKRQGRFENLKKLALEFIKDAKVNSKDVAEQAKEFFKEYSEDLGTIYYEVREKVREILNRNYEDNVK